MFKIATFFALCWIPVAWAEDIAPAALNSFTVVPPIISQAKVFQQDGSLLGNIRGISLAPGGAGQVMIGVAGGHEIALSAADASYDEANNVVVTDAIATKLALGSH